MGRSLSMLAFLLVSIATCHAASQNEVYWNSVLPNTPMPRAIRDHLHLGGSSDEKVDDTPISSSGAGVGVMIGPDGNRVTVDRGVKAVGDHHYLHAVDTPISTGAGVGVMIGPDGNQVTVDRGVKAVGDHHYLHATSLNYDHENPFQVDRNRIDRRGATGFFLEKDLRSGAKVKLQFGRGFSGDRFLPPNRVAEYSIHFRSTKFPEILSLFQVQKGSAEAEHIRQVLEDCEVPAARGENKLCANSLESMVDFVTSELGTHDIGTLSTKVDRRAAPEQMYTVWSVDVQSEASTTTSAVCHSLVYPYTVFLCHVIPNSKPYVVRLVGEKDGARVVAAAICHADTSAWSPKQQALQAFELKPGAAESVCHFLTEGDVLSIPKSSPGGGRSTA